MIKNKGLIERFLRYVKIDTQSSEDSNIHPSTDKQRNLADMLADELRAMGVETDYDREKCVVYGYLPANDGSEKSLGFISHMDTSPEVTDTNVKPHIIENYDGTDSLLSTEEFPELLNHIGEDIIRTDGTTLLGADDKAGVSEIMNCLEYFTSHPKIKHIGIAVAFTPDEEIGGGTENFELNRFKAKEAYTVDGGKWGIVEYECFNAASADVVFTGKNVHTGDAKNVMVNAMKLAMEFDSMLPPAEVPEHTEGYEGFYHLDGMSGTVEKAELKYIIRDHDTSNFERRKQFMQNIAEYMNNKYGENRVELKIRDQYRNMSEIIKDHMNLIENAFDAVRSLGTEPQSLPIRGGTDGALLSFRGLPCPNLCTGGYNYHSRYEYASVQEMEKTAELLIKLVES